MKHEEDYYSMRDILEDKNKREKWEMRQIEIYGEKLGFQKIKDVFTPADERIWGNFRDRIIKFTESAIEGVNKSQVDHYLKNRFKEHALDFLRRYQINNNVTPSSVHPIKEFVRYASEMFEYLEKRGVDLEEFELAPELEESSNTTKGKVQINGDSCTVAQLALYYFYLHEKGIENVFEKHPGGKVKAIEEVAEKFRCSAKTFQTWYNKLIGKDYRYSKVKDMEKVITLLAKHPEAKKLAQDEQKTASLKNR